jgi:hypothetical protein
MAYRNFYNRLPGVQATFNDGNLANVAPEIKSGAKLLIASSADQGYTNRLFSVDSLESVITEFGESSSIAKSLQLARANGAQNVDVVKVNGKQSHLLIKKAVAGADFQTETIIKISPKRTGKMFVGTTNANGNDTTVDVLAGYAIALLPFKKGNIFKQRVLAYQINNVNQPRTLVYDSEMLLATNLSAFDIEINNEPGNDQILVTPGFFNTADVDPDVFEISLEAAVNAFDNKQIKVTLLQTLSQISASDISVFQASKSADSLPSEDNGYSVVRFQPDNIDQVTHLERFAGLEVKYHDLDYLDADFIYCDGCFADIAPVELGALAASEKLEYGAHKLGYMWKYIYEGKPYVFFFGRKNPFDSANIVSSYEGISGKLDFEFSGDQKKLGDLLNLVDLKFHVDSALDLLEPALEIFTSDTGRVECHISTKNGFIAQDTALPFCTLAPKHGLTINHVLTEDIEDLTDIGVSDAATLSFQGKTLSAGQKVVLFGQTTTVANNDKVYTVTKVVNAGADNDEWSLVVDNGSTTTYAAAKIADGVSKTLRPSLVGNDERALSILLESGSYNTDAFVETPHTLYGSLVPEAVIERLFTYTLESVSLVASSIEVREVNFLHQAAMLAYKASNTTSQTIAFVPCSAPPASNDGVMKWAGDSPVYNVDNSGTLVVQSAGTGIQGNKLLFGAPDYRGGLPFGGVILTTGQDLPNQEPYGIDDEDEASDARGTPIDIGKHAVVVGSWGTFTPATATQYKVRVNRAQYGFANLAPAVVARLISLPVHSEPIGPVNGVVAGVSVLGARIPKATLNTLALGRVCMFDQNGALAILRTAALPNSDYTRVSTIRVANRILGAIRAFALPYLGRSVNYAKTALAQQLQGFMTSEVRNRYIQGYNPVQIYSSRADEIAGRMSVSVSFIPPFSLELVNVDMTILPPQ